MDHKTIPSIEAARQAERSGDSNPLTRFILMYGPVMASLQPAFINALDAALGFVIEREMGTWR